MHIFPQPSVNTACTWSLRSLQPGFRVTWADTIVSPLMSAALQLCSETDSLLELCHRRELAWVSTRAYVAVAISANTLADSILKNILSFTSGKSLYVKRLHGKLKRSSKKPSVLKCIRLIEPKVDENSILQSLLESTKKSDLTIFHLDVTSSVSSLTFKNI